MQSDITSAHVPTTMKETPRVTPQIPPLRPGPLFVVIPEDETKDVLRGPRGHLWPVTWAALLISLGVAQRRLFQPETTSRKRLYDD